MVSAQVGATLNQSSHSPISSSNGLLHQSWDPLIKSSITSNEAGASTNQASCKYSSIISSSNYNRASTSTSALADKLNKQSLAERANLYDLHDRGIIPLKHCKKQLFQIQNTLHPQVKNGNMKPNTTFPTTEACLKWKIHQQIIITSLHRQAIDIYKSAPEDKTRSDN